MNRRLVGVVLGAAALSGSALLAGSADAAPGDVTAAASVTGNVVKVTVTNNSAGVIACNMFAFDSPVSESSVVEYGDASRSIEGVPYGAIPSNGTFSFTLHKVDHESTDPYPFGTTTVENGTYDVGWMCGTMPDGSAQTLWGTKALVDVAVEEADPGTLVHNGIAPWITVTVPGTGTGPSPEPCTGSLCGLGISLPRI